MKAEEYNAKRQADGHFEADHIVRLVEFWQQEHDLLVDGKAGKFTLASIEAEDPSNYAMRAIEVATEEIGEGEIGWNNSGPAIHKYRNLTYDDQAPRRLWGEWCSFFVGWVLEEAARRDGIVMPFRRYWAPGKPHGGAKKLAIAIAEGSGRMVNPKLIPIPGDIVVWDRGKKGSWQGHIALVSRTVGSLVYTIEGNVGRYPAVVHEREHDWDRQPRIEYVVRV